MLSLAAPNRIGLRRRRDFVQSLAPQTFQMSRVCLLVPESETTSLRKSPYELAFRGFEP